MSTLPEKTQIKDVQLTQVGDCWKLIPSSILEAQLAADYLCASSLIPAAFKRKEDATIAIMMGAELGLSAMKSLQSIQVIQGKPTLSVEAMRGLVMAHHLCESIEDKPIIKDEKLIGYECIVKRKGHPPHSARFTIEMARAAGLIGSGRAAGGNWEKYPSRMLSARATGYALRDKFADLLGGFPMSAEEAKDMKDLVDVTTPSYEVSTPVDAVDNLISRFDISESGSEATETVNEITINSDTLESDILSE